ncbi:MAG: nuclear transport factor 2 family protein [Chloroflexota bacterium]
MSRQDNERIARDAMGALMVKDTEKFLSFLTDQAAFRFPGNTPISGVFKGKDAIREWFQEIVKVFPTGLIFTTIDVVSSDSEAAVEWSDYGTAANGYQYKNWGITAFQIEDGRVIDVRDYLDTDELHAAMA